MPLPDMLPAGDFLGSQPLPPAVREERSPAFGGPGVDIPTIPSNPGVEIGRGRAGALDADGHEDFGGRTLAEAEDVGACRRCTGIVAAGV